MKTTKRLSSRGNDIQMSELLLGDALRALQEGEGDALLRAELALKRCRSQAAIEERLTNPPPTRKRRRPRSEPLSTTIGELLRAKLSGDQ